MCLFGLLLISSLVISVRFFYCVIDKTVSSLKQLYYETLLNAFLLLRPILKYFPLEPIFGSHKTSNQNISFFKCFSLSVERLKKWLRRWQPWLWGMFYSIVLQTDFFRIIGLTAEITEDHTIRMIIFLCISRIHLEWQELTLGEPVIINDVSWTMVQHLRESTEANLQKRLRTEVQKSQ